MVRPYIDPRYPKSFKEASAIYVLDSKKNKLQEIGSFPEVYRKGVYGINYAKSYYAYNEKENNLIISYPADPNLYKYDIKNAKMSTHAAPSKYFDDIPSSKKPIEDGDDGFRFYILYSQLKGFIFRDMKIPRN